MPSNTRVRGASDFMAYVPPPDHSVYRQENPRPKVSYRILTKPEAKGKWYLYCEETSLKAARSVASFMDPLTCPYIKLERVESTAIEYRRIES